MSVWVLLWIARPDVGTWLRAQTDGYFFPDAFEFVSRSLPILAVFLTVTSLFAAVLVLCGRWQYLLVLAAGPLIGILAYVIGYGFSDPAWHSFLLLWSLGMFVGTPVTLALVIRNAWRSRNACKESG